MTDLVFLQLIAGKGGDGRVSFRREKYIPFGGPDGGDGGDGGNIIIKATDSENTLRWYAGKTQFVAGSGEMGGKRNCFGKKGTDVVLEVPIGTIIWQLTENQIAHQRRLVTGCKALLKKDQVQKPLYSVEKDGAPVPEREPDSVFNPEVWDEVQEMDHFAPEELKAIKLFEFTELGQELVVVQGGFGGKGNDAFKSAAEQAPLRAQYGTFAEERYIALELRLLADVGLVGLPNAGKSTLLSILTKARPKIASYPFTTLEPNLGILHDPASQKEVVLADIPGLIEGASEGKGLGYEFLRHVKNCKALVFVLTLEESQIFDTDLSVEEKASLLWRQYETLKHELETFDPTLLEKRQLLSLSKIDIYNVESLDVIRSLFKQKSSNLIAFSAVTGQGMDELRRAVVELIE